MHSHTMLVGRALSTHHSLSSLQAIADPLAVIGLVLLSIADPDQYWWGFIAAIVVTILMIPMGIQTVGYRSYLLARQASVVLMLYSQ